ncbi:DUF4166 domain-containing protein [Pseudonocardia sp. TMWB2A]|uniref:DUF4166 domain-containing protein n=1 Tax=Pseudonocardia sp. TMWB2A TaxID=687430 RepID=UPI00307D8730
MDKGAAIAIRHRFASWHPVPAARAAADAHPFRRLLGAAGWAALPPAVQARFARKVAGGACVSYVGEVVSCRMSLIGKIFAQLARFVGAPLPLGEDAGGAAQVSVTGDASGLSQYWTRSYARAGDFPQTIHSVKRFAGPTGLEEYLGYGIGIALRLEVAEQALLFVSDHYFVRLGGVRVRLPRWMEPGQLTVSHIDCGADEQGRGRFAFVLELAHPLFGELFHQLALFADPEGEAA